MTVSDAVIGRDLIAGELSNMQLFVEPTFWTYASHSDIRMPLTAILAL